MHGFDSYLTGLKQSIARKSVPVQELEITKCFVIHHKEVIFILSSYP